MSPCLVAVTMLVVLLLPLVSVAADTGRTNQVWQRFPDDRREIQRIIGALVLGKRVTGYSGLPMITISPVQVVRTVSIRFVAEWRQGYDFARDAVIEINGAKTHDWVFTHSTDETFQDTIDTTVSNTVRAYTIYARDDDLQSRYYGYLYVDGSQVASSDDAGPLTPLVYVIPAEQPPPPVCSEGAVNVLEMCPDGSWSHRQVCRNNAWADEYQQCPTPPPPSNPPQLTLYQPTVDGLTVTVNGVTTPGAPGASITRLGWNWGDGQSGDYLFPASYTYGSGGTYTITVTAYQSDGQSTTRTVTAAVTGGQPSQGVKFRGTVVSMSPDGIDYEVRIGEILQDPSGVLGVGTTASVDVEDNSLIVNGPIQVGDEVEVYGELYNANPSGPGVSVVHYGQYIMKISGPTCSEGAVNVLEWCPDGSWSHRQVCKNNAWQDEYRQCPTPPVCNEGDVQVLETCPDGSWSHRQVCKNNAWHDENRPCPTKRGHLQIVSVYCPMSLGSHEMGQTISCQVGVTNVGQGVIPAGTNYTIITDLVDYKGKGADVWQGFDTIPAWKYGSQILQEEITEVTTSYDYGPEKGETFQYDLKLSNDWTGDPIIFTNTLQVQAVSADGSDSTGLCDLCKIEFRVWPATEDTVWTLIGLVVEMLPPALGYERAGEMYEGLGAEPSHLEFVVHQAISVIHDIAQKDWKEAGNDLRDLVFDVCGFLACDPVVVAVNLARSAWDTGRTIAYAIVLIGGFIFAVAEKSKVGLCELWARVFDKTACFIAGSDVRLLVAAPDGSRIGGGLQGGQWADFEEVKEAWYSGLDSHPQYIVISEPESGSYRLIVTGKESGVFQLAANSAVNGSTVATKQYSGTIGQGETQEYSSELASDGNLVMKPAATLSDSYWLLAALAGMAIAAVLGGVLLMHRRRDGHKRRRKLPGPIVKEIASTAAKPIVKSIQETGTKPRVLKVEEE